MATSRRIVRKGTSTAKRTRRDTMGGESADDVTPNDSERSVLRAKKVGDRKSRVVEKRLRTFTIGEGVPAIPKMLEELQDMTDVLLGREDPPINAGYLSLMEVADAYYARASELTMLLQAAEREGRILKGSAHAKFRTGELRTFAEMAKRAADLGSRRLTQAQMDAEASRFGRESRGFRGQD